VTSILRESLVCTSSSNDATDDLIELLESHCQISPGVAREVLSTIALAVQTGVVPDLSGGVAKGSNSISDNIDKPTTRSRSKSVGAEPAYDVEFLGKILRDAMIMQDPLRSSHMNMNCPSTVNSGTSTLDTSYSSLGNSLNVATDGSRNSCFFAPEKKRTKRRSVTFDETHSSHYDTTQSEEPRPAVTSSSIWYSVLPMMLSTPSTFTRGIAEEDSQVFEPLGGNLDVLVFEPLEGILDVLDLEGENEKQRQTKDGITHKGADGEKSKYKVSDANRKIFSHRLESKGKTGNCATTNDIDRNTPRSFSSKHLSQKKQKSCNSEANDLAAALFRPSRPRSKSLNYRQRPMSPALTPMSLSASSGIPSSSGILSESPSSSGPGQFTPLLSGRTRAASNSDIRFSSPSSTSFNNSAELNSTVQLLLTLNSHLGHEAATLASQLTDGDLNLAQYLIEGARSDSSSGNSYRTDSHYQQRRSRICRHELRGICYRADCPYSHDLTGVTCLFWLRGRCRENNCRFLHGFAESLLEGICKEYLVEQKAKKEEKELKRLAKLEEEEKNKIHTTNLLHHNQW